MEIESDLYRHLSFSCPREETKKVSWKWRLKAAPRRLLCVAEPLETKKVSWKWRLKVFTLITCCLFHRYETKKVSWKWRLKAAIIVLNSVVVVLWHETKKVSWKWRLKVSLFSEELRLDFSFETKKVSWKWRLKGSTIFIPYSDRTSKQRKSPENGDWKYFISSVLTL